LQILKYIGRNYVNTTDKLRQSLDGFRASHDGAAAVQVAERLKGE
jgi:hypothetical protein